MASCNPIQFILWLLILIFISFIVAFFCAPVYSIVHCLAGFITPLSKRSARNITTAPKLTKMRNIEIKASIRDWQAIKTKAEELSGSDGTIIEQCDTFFKVPKGRLKLRRFEDDSGELIFYQRPDTAGPKLSDYKKTNVHRENFQGLRDVLAESNGILGTVIKTRLLYIVGQSRVHIDHVIDLGRFAEIEVVLRDDETIEDGQRISNDLMTKLGIESDDLISKAYLDLLIARNVV